jgi:capsid protein
MIAYIARRDMPDEIQPSMIQHVKAGSVPHTITPPKADTGNYDASVKRDIAVGTGISYEQLSGDYSLVNFASGRMAKMDFFAELDHMQFHILLPSLNKIFTWFNTIYQIKNGSGRYKADWTFPPRAAVNPKEEFDVLMSKVRHGMKSPSKAAKELGEKLEIIMETWNKDKKLFGDMPFDIDPSVFASTGNQLDDNDAASSNKKPVTDDTKKDDK